MCDGYNTAERLERTCRASQQNSRRREANRLQQSPACKWFFQERNARSQQLISRDQLAGITGHIDRRRDAASSVAFDHQIEASRMGESPKVSIARQQRNTTVDARLCNQSVAEPCFTPPCQRLRPKESSPLPVTLTEVDHRNIAEGRSDPCRQLGIAQKLGEHHRYHDDLSVAERVIQQTRVRICAAFEISDPRTCVGCNHRKDLWPDDWLLARPASAKSALCHEADGVERRFRRPQAVAIPCEQFP